MSSEYEFSLMILLFAPLVGAVFSGLCSQFKKMGNWPELISTSVMFASFMQAISLTLKLANSESITGDVHFFLNLGNWLTFEGFKSDFAFRFDHLSSVMCLVITGVGSLIHLYSIGYMSSDESKPRFFSYLNIFCFFMLCLVLANSIPLLFVGWEGVGLCSYLLIGFWYKDKVNSLAANKAFIVNRIGDLGFLIGTFIVFREMGSLEFTDINNVAKSLVVSSAPELSLAALCFFIGASGKSAQFPLYIWLPDAMQGPTPVSALIHAATMVTAGVYFLIRLAPFFLLSPNILMLIGIVGLLTAFLAGTMALVQNDIKKVLAYSTISQLGFMFLACAVGAFDTALFHVITHAFFKALLFLAAGSVIHACHGEQDMNKMGGLKWAIPQTFWLMTIGALALAGIIPFAGFFSKDEIIYSSLALPMGNISFYLLAQLIAILTSFYTARMIALVFLGQSRMNPKLKSEIHESPIIMLIPLYVLAFCTIFGGVLGLPHYMSNILGHVPPLLKSWLITVVPLVDLPETAHGLSEGIVSLISGLFAILFFWLGIKFFTKNEKSEHNRKHTSITSVFEKLYYENFIINWLIQKPFHWFSNILLKFFENSVLQKIPVFVGLTTKFSSRKLGLYHSGNLNFYSFCLGFGLMLLFVYCGLMIF